MINEPSSFGYAKVLLCFIAMYSIFGQGFKYKSHNCFINMFDKIPLSFVISNGIVKKNRLVKYP